MSWSSKCTVLIVHFGHDGRRKVHEDTDCVIFVLVVQVVVVPDPADIPLACEEITGV